MYLLKRILRIFWKVVVALFLLLLLVLFVFSIPMVQTRMAQKLTGLINEKYGTEIKIDRVSFTYDARVNLKDVYIGDHHRDTLISSESLRTSLMNLNGLLQGENIDFGSVTAHHLTFRLRRYAADDKDNFGVFLDKLAKENPDKEKGPRVNLSRVFVIDSKFSFVDEHVNYPDIIRLDNLNIDASNFVIHGQDISVNINTLRADEGRGIPFEDLALDFELNDSIMNFNNFHLVTADSDIKARIHFTYDETLQDFENKVQLDAEFGDSFLSTTDLQKLYENFGPHHLLNFQGNLKGVLNDLEISDFYLNGIQQTQIDGTVYLKNIFGDDPFSVNSQLNLLATSYEDLIRLLPGILRDPLPEELSKLGRSNLRGSLGATSGGVTMKAKITTDLGEAEVEGKLFNLQSQGRESYEGKVSFYDFELGEFLDNPDFGATSLGFVIKGKGFTRESLDTHLDGLFNKIEFKGYSYKNVLVNGDFKFPTFTGSVVGFDPNLRMAAEGLVNFSKSHNRYNFKADIAHADVRSLGFMNKDSTAIFQGKVNMDMQGTNLNDLAGTIALSNVSIKNKKDVYNFEQLDIESTFDGVVRSIGIRSPDIVNGRIQGYFNLTEVPDLLRNAVGNLYANYTPIPIAQNQYIDFDVAIYNKFIEAVFPDLSVAPNTTFWGKIRSSNSDVKMEFRSPEVKVFNSSFTGVNLNIDNKSQLSTTNLIVEDIQTNSYGMKDLQVVSNRKKDTLYLRTQFKGGDRNEDEFKFNFYHTINKDNKSVVGIRRSNLKYKGNTWLLNRDKTAHTIVFDNEFNDVKVDTLSMTFEDQKITFFGEKHGSVSKDFKLDFYNTDLAKVIPTIEDFELRGVINGGLQVRQVDGTYYPSTDLTISDFWVNTIKYGNLDLDITGNQSLTSYAVEARLKDQKRTLMTADGIINVSDRNPSIDVDVALNDFKVDILNAFGGEVITDIRGTASGNAHIGGNYKKPTLSGAFDLHKAGLKIPYLNVNLNLEENAKVKLSEQEFYFDDVDFTDAKYGTAGVIDGSLGHVNFREWNMDMNINAPQRLLALDTEYTDEALYYGTAFISGGARIHGPFEELVIDINATSEKGTVFKIPLSDSESLISNEYIYFLTAEDKKARSEGKEIIVEKLKGLSVNFDLDITDDAEIEIVVDKKSGSSLRGKGAGTILMEINTTGKFNMWGDFVVYSGVYNFRYAGLVEKQFEVVSGGSVTWDGSPFQANLNVRALYQTEANPASLLENPTINRTIPINVYVGLSGLLTDVDINFELEYPNLSSVVKSELEYRISDRKDTEIQALSLITQRSFYNEMGGGRTTHPENLLYERAAGLFNDIFSSADDKFKVGVNYTKGNRNPEQDITDQVGVTLSTNVNDRILINGRVGVPIGGLTRSVVVGDVEIEFLLNEAGNLRAKMFNRESDIQYIGEELGYTQGVGLSYSVDFDSFKEMIQKILNRKLELAEIPKQLSDTAEEKPLVPDFIKFPGQ